MLIGMSLMPYSARWLALKGRMEEAEKALRFFMKTGVEEAMAEIQQQVGVMMMIIMMIIGSGGGG
jgi:hypothetical protein